MYVYTHIHTYMGWLRLVGCLKTYVSLQNIGLFCRYLLQKRPIFLSILLIVATPYINIRSICMECTLFYASDVLGINTYIYLFIFIYTYIYIYTCIQSYISEVSGCSAPYSARVVLGIYVCIYGINICPLYVYIHNYAWMNIYI